MSEFATKEKKEKKDETYFYGFRFPVLQDIKCNYIELHISLSSDQADLSVVGYVWLLSLKVNLIQLRLAGGN